MIQIITAKKTLPGPVFQNLLERQNYFLMVPILAELNQITWPFLGIEMM